MILIRSASHFHHAGQVCLVLSTVKGRQVFVRFFFVFLQFEGNSLHQKNPHKTFSPASTLLPMNSPLCNAGDVLSGFLLLRLHQPWLYLHLAVFCALHNSENFLKNNYGSNEAKTCHVVIQSTCLHRPLFSFFFHLFQTANDGSIL